MKHENNHINIMDYNENNAGLLILGQTPISFITLTIRVSPSMVIPAMTRSM